MDGIMPFAGKSEVSIAEAVAIATSRANQWLETHQWKVSDGRPAYTTTIHAMYTNLGDAVCIVMLIGPLEESPER